MVIRGVYSDIEKKILEEFDKESDKRQGWSGAWAGRGSLPGSSDPEATIEAMKEFALGVDPWNPFWYIPKYAIPSRWGGLIAHPFFIERFRPFESMMKSHSGYFLTFYLLGHDFEYFQPIRPGDIVRAWQYRPWLEDITDLSGKGPRQFRYIDVKCDFINQRDELIGTFRMPVWITLYEGQPPVERFLPDYGYSMEELDLLAELTENETPRGSKTRYWEDVEVGDEPRTITSGPITYQNTGRDATVSINPDGVRMRTFPHYEEPLGAPIEFGYVPDRETGLLYPTHGVGRHISDRAAQYEGGRRAWIFNTDARRPLLRSVTNWMGNDAFLCKFSWRHVWRTPIGDALLVKGEVVKKYVENDEHLVDLKVWCLNLRGCITDFAVATIKLVSKEDNFPTMKKVIKR